MLLNSSTELIMAEVGGHGSGSGGACAGVCVWGGGGEKVGTI